MDVKTGNAFSDKFRELEGRINRGWSVWTEKIKVLEEENRVLREKLSQKLEGTVEIWRRRSDEMETSWKTAEDKIQHLDKRLKEEGKSWLRRLETKDEEISFLKSELARLEEQVDLRAVEFDAEKHHLIEEKTEKIEELEKLIAQERNSWAQTLRSMRMHISHQRTRSQADRDREKNEFLDFRNRETEKIEKQKKELLEKENNWQTIIRSLERRLSNESQQSVAIIEKNENKIKELHVALKKKHEEFENLEGRMKQETELLKKELRELVDRNIKESESEVLELKERIKDLEDENSELRRNIIDREGRITGLTKTIEKINFTLNNEKTRRIKLEKDKDEFVKRHKESEQALRDIEERFSRERDEWSREWGNREEALREEVRKKEEEIENLNEQIRTRDRSMQIAEEKTEKERERYKQDIIEKEREKQEIREQYVNDMAVLKEKIESMRSGREKELRLKIKEIESRASEEIEALKMKLKEEIVSSEKVFLKEKETLKDKIKGLSEEIKDRESGYRQKIAQFKAEMEKKDADLAELREHYIAEIRSMQESLEKERKSCSDAVKNMEEKLSETRNSEQEKLVSELENRTNNEIQLLKSRLAEELQVSEKRWEQERLVRDIRIRELKEEVDEKDRLYRGYTEKLKSELGLKESELAELKKSYIEDIRHRDEMLESERRTWAENMRKMEKIIKEQKK